MPVGPLFTVTEVAGPTGREIMTVQRTTTDADAATALPRSPLEQLEDVINEVSNDQAYMVKRELLVGLVPDSAASLRGTHSPTHYPPTPPTSTVTHVYATFNARFNTLFSIFSHTSFYTHFWHTLTPSLFAPRNVNHSDRAAQHHGLEDVLRSETTQLRRIDGQHHRVFLPRNWVEFSVFDSR